LNPYRFIPTHNTSCESFNHVNQGSDILAFIKSYLYCANVKSLHNTMKRLLTLSILFCASFLHAQNIYTVAGKDTGSYSGDGGAAVLSGLYNPTGIALDASGNLFIADLENHRIRKVNASGIISTVAGSGVSGYSGDGGAATAAEFKNPAGVAVDASGNIYIADASNNRIRKVNTGNIITTIAGNGFGTGTSFGGYSGDGGPATAAELNFPTGVAVDDSGNLFIADYFNHRIRKVNTLGIISTVAGDSIGAYSGDGGPATAAELHAPLGIAVDASGNIFITDNGNSRIRKVNSLGIISTVAGDGTPGYSGDGGVATAAELLYPFGLTVDASGNLFIADYYNNVIRQVDTSGIISTVAGNDTAGYSGDKGAATAAELFNPSGIAVDTWGNLFIADQKNNRIREVTKGSPLIINTFTNMQDLTIYPIPTSGQFTVQFDNGNSPITNTTLSIYDMLGKQVYTQSINASQSNLNVNLDDGIYILRVVSDRGVVSKRIEVMR